MQKRVLSVRGFPSLGTEVWELPATTSPAVHICIVPGNPGSAGYYGTFMRCLHREFEGKAVVTSVSSMGFHTLDSSLHTDYRTFTLEEQCEHKAAFLLQHVFPSHNLPVVVMGHSIGIYMAMRAVHKCENCAGYASNVDSSNASPTVGQVPMPDRGQDTKQATRLPRVIQLVGLMPFVLTTPQNSTQRRLRFLASIRGMLAAAGAMLTLLPLTLRRSLAVAGGGKMDETSVETTAALLRPDVIRVAFTLAHHEFSDLDHDAKDGWRDMAQFASQSRLAVLAAPDDAWWPQAQHSRACQLVPETMIEMQPEQVHAFCTRPSLCATAAVTCERWIRQALADRASHTSRATTCMPPAQTTSSGMDRSSRGAGSKTAQTRAAAGASLRLRHAPTAAFKVASLHGKAPRIVSGVVAAGRTVRMR